MSRSHYGFAIARHAAGVHLCLCVVAALVVSSVALPVARADDFTWTGDSPFNGGIWWDDSANWSALDPFGFPDNSTDNVTVGTDPKDAHLVANRTIGDLELTGTGEVFLDGFLLRVEANSGAGRLGGTLLTGDGSRIVVGSGTLRTDLLDILDGARVEVTGGTVRVDVSAGIGAGGTFNARGTLQLAGLGGLTNQGTISTKDGDLTIDRIASSGDFEQQATLTVDANHTLLIDIPTSIDGGTTTVGGSATLEFDLSATLNAGTINVGNNATMRFDGPTTWAGANVNEMLGTKTGIVRQNGTATVSANTAIGVRVYDFDGLNVNASTTIEAGAALTLKVDFIDTDSTGTGDNNSYEGTVTIEDTARLDVSTFADEWFNSSTGTILLQGMPVTEPLAVVGGQAELTNRFGGTIEGNGTFEVDVTNGNGGIVRPGLSEGVINFKKNFTQQTGGVLEIEITDNPANGHDQIFVGGDATLGGTLDVSLLKVLADGGLEFEIIDVAGALSGTFDNLGEGDHVGALDKSVFITYHGGDGNDVVLFTESGVLGDYNSNGIVDAADYTVWRDNLGNNVTIPNDATPGMVTAQDYNVWKVLFGNVSGSGAASLAAVPEPASGCLGLLGLGALALRQRHQERAATRR